MKNPVLIIGANYLGRTAKEIFEKNGVVVYGFLDDDSKLHNQEIDDVMILGSSEDEELLKLIGKKCEAFVAVDDNRLRKSLVKMLVEEKKTQPVNAIHLNALISDRAEIGHGNLIDNGAILSVGSKVGSYGILGARSIVGVETEIGDYVQVGMGSTIGQGVKIEDEVFIGSGVTVVSGITIGKGARVGVGSVVVAPVGAGETVFGNPAQKVKS